MGKYPENRDIHAWNVTTAVKNMSSQVSEGSQPRSNNKRKGEDSAGSQPAPNNKRKGDNNAGSQPRRNNKRKGEDNAGSQQQRNNKRKGPEDNAGSKKPPPPPQKPPRPPRRRPPPARARRPPPRDCFICRRNLAATCPICEVLYMLNQDSIRRCPVPKAITCLGCGSVFHECCIEEREARVPRQICPVQTPQTCELVRIDL